MDSGVGFGDLVYPYSSGFAPGSKFIFLGYSASVDWRDRVIRHLIDPDKGKWIGKREAKIAFRPKVREFKDTPAQLKEYMALSRYSLGEYTDYLVRGSPKEVKPIEDTQAVKDSDLAASKTKKRKLPRSSPSIPKDDYCLHAIGVYVNSSGIPILYDPGKKKEFELHSGNMKIIIDKLVGGMIGPFLCY